MGIRSVLFIILGCSLGMGLLPAQESQPAPPAASAPATQAAHPFLDTSFYPAWSKMTGKDVLADAKAAMETAKARFDAVRAVEPGSETYENVFEAIEYADREAQNVAAYWNHLMMVCQGTAGRQAQQALMPMLTEFRAGIVSDPALREVVRRAARQPWVQGLSPAKRLYVQEQLERFNESAGLTPQMQRHQRQAVAEHMRMQRLFDKNVINSPRHWCYEVKDPNELAGMPEAWIRRAAAGGMRNGNLVLPLGTAYDILRHCTVESTRRTFREGLDTIGNLPDFNNEPVIQRILRLRLALALFAGFENYADKICAKRMLNTGGKALAFVDDLIDKLRPAYDRENKELLAYISECKGEPQTAVNPWDYDFYRERLTRRKNAFDTESVRPYLRSDNVLHGMFAVASKLYGITISEEPSAYVRPGETGSADKAEVWHPDVRIFKVTDDKTGAHLGSFYYDPYPRFGKQWGAWTQAMRPGRPGKNGAPREPHLVVLCANFSPPADHPYALFSPREAEQLFHEFGHTLHNILSDTELYQHTGTYVELDFAELPSQLFENWFWEPEVISTFAFHHETGEPMPAEMVRQLVASRYSMPATAAMERLFTAKLDLEMHVHYAQKFAGKPLDDACAAILAPLRIPMAAPSPSIMRSCTHCFARNYGAGYFCYAWSEVLAADVFSRFKKEGLLNPETGAEFRHKVLRPGGDIPALELYRSFMGRDPQPDALLERYGVK